MSQPNYYAIITADVRYDRDLVANAKLLYGEITALSMKEGYCWATNEYFAGLYNVSNTTVSEWIRQLNEKGYVYSEVQNNYERKIFIKGGFREKPKGASEKAEGGASEKAEDSITSINIKNSINEKLSKNSEIEEESEIESTLGFPTPEGWSSEYEGGDSDTLASLVWYDENGKWVKQAEINRRKKEYLASVRKETPKVVNTVSQFTPPLKRQYLTKQPYIHNTDTDFKNMVTDLMVKTLCSKQGIPKLDGKGIYKSADELRDTFKSHLEKMGVKDLDDQKLIVQFGFFLDKVKQKSDFHWNNMTSMEYINRNFYKLDKLIK